jgi:hypothetical protein
MIVGSRFPELRFRLHGNFEIAGESPRMDEPQSSPAGSRGRWRFGVFDFDGQTLELSKNGRLVAARPQPLKLLALLVAIQPTSSHGRICSGRSGAARHSSTSSKA